LQSSISGKSSSKATHTSSITQFTQWWPYPQVTTDPESTRNPIYESGGTITSDSLAGESQNSGGSFGAGNPKATASKQPSKSTNTNNTDTSGATRLDPAVDAHAREAQDGWSEESQLQSGKGLGKESGVGPTYNTIGSSVNSSGTTRGVSTGTAGGADVQGNIAPTAGYSHTAQDLGKPKGKNITEDPELTGKTAFGKVGTKMDAGRQAELDFAKRAANAGGVSDRDIAQGGDSKFSGLDAESRTWGVVWPSGEYNCSFKSVVSTERNESRHHRVLRYTNVQVSKVKVKVIKRPPRGAAIPIQPLPSAWNFKVAFRDTERNFEQSASKPLRHPDFFPSTFRDWACSALPECDLLPGMNDHGLDDEAFGASKGGIVSSFDAFRKSLQISYGRGQWGLGKLSGMGVEAAVLDWGGTLALGSHTLRRTSLTFWIAKTKKTYLVQGRNSSAWTVTLILTCIYLSWSEISRWFAGTTSQSFSVEKGVSHDMQMNLDIIIAMRCADLRVNMQDAAGDRTMAGDLLRTDPTNWAQWTGRKMEKGMHELGKDDGVNPGWEELWDVHEQLGKARKRKFSSTPRLKGAPDACRMYGSLEGNKVQGDFHITARGHGYQEFGEHLDHKSKSNPSTHPFAEQDF
jgi:hypothetical protein